MVDIPRGIDPDTIHFIFEPIDDLQKIGGVTFYNSGRFPGSICLDNESFRWNEVFEYRFGGGEYVAKSPGVMASQVIRVRLRNQDLEYTWNHERELARTWYGDRPVVEIESPSGEVMLFQYRPDSAKTSSWFRVVPTLSDSPALFALMSNHEERVTQLFLYGGFMCGSFLLVSALPLFGTVCLLICCLTK